MAVKYFFEFTDLEGINHRVDIASDDFTGEATEISGEVNFDYAENDGVLDYIKGNGLTIDILADENINFLDLYSETDRFWKTTYTRNSIVLFNGFLKPDGLFQSFVQDRYIISLDCVDGLSYLKDLSYVDSGGFPFVGNQSLLEIIVNCLKRTEIALNINISLDFFYSGLAETESVAENVFFDTQRFVKDDNDTIMNCDEVLKSVLTPYNAVITQYNNEWYIYKPINFVNNSSLDFFCYDSDGNALTPSEKTLNIDLLLGSQINGFYPHHSGANQQISLKNGIGAFRVNYKYGFVKSLVDNIYLEHNGSTIDDWNINSFSNINLGSEGFGVVFTFSTFTSSVLNLTSDLITITSSDSLDITIKYDTIQSPPSSNDVFSFFRYKIILDTGSTVYYYSSSNTWTTFNTFLQADSDLEGTSSIIKQTIFAPPENGDLRVEIYTPTTTVIGPGPTTSRIFLNEVSFAPINTANNNLKGEFHTFQRTDKPPVKINSVKEVFNGDTPSELYVGVIYKSDGATPTQTWNRKGKTESLEILRLMGLETMLIQQKPAIIFSGDVYGYIPYLSRIRIDGLDGVFYFLNYSYNAKQNTTSIKVIQIFDEELLDLEYRKTFDFGNVVKPTIKG